MPQEFDRRAAYTKGLVALGGNVTSLAGHPGATLERALEHLAQLQGAPVQASRLFRTPSFPAGSGPDYVNAVARIETDLSATDLLAALHAIEAAFGRERDTRWAARTLDLDLLDFGGAVLPDLATYAAWRDLPLEAQMRAAPDRLILPHPRIQDRAFVLVPLADIAADWVHPVSGQSVTEMLAALPEADKAAIRPL